VENGFYYDFDVEVPFHPDGGPGGRRSEARMRQIVKQGQRVSPPGRDRPEAREELAASRTKLELIGLKGHASGSQQFESGEAVEVGSGDGAELTIYDNLDPPSGELCWKDLCRGPHNCRPPGPIRPSS